VPSVIAVDWSGDSHLARSRIYLAEANEPGRLTRLTAGRTRAELTEHLSQTRAAAIGLDFGFSFPHTFLDQLGVRSAPELWRLAVEHGEAWIAACEQPFWGRPGRPRTTDAQWRKTEISIPRVAGIAPKSMFQIGGAGAVGTGSIRGMPLLLALHASGARIWPYTHRGTPTVVEIYPRLLTGPVHKSNAHARRALLDERYPHLQAEFRDVATASEDAFDAAVSALVMIEHVQELTCLPAEADPNLRREGRIWHPAWRDDPI
jgi:hypothetical protein